MVADKKKTVFCQCGNVESLMGFPSWLAECVIYLPVRNNLQMFEAFTHGCNKKSAPW